MASSNHPIDPKQMPVQRPVPSEDINHFTREWWSGARGGGKVPKDFGWPTSPKQHQEEFGVGDAEQPISK